MGQGGNDSNIGNGGDDNVVGGGDDDDTSTAGPGANVFTCGDVEDTIIDHNPDERDIKAADCENF
jgi:hypothetical protein